MATHRIRLGKWGEDVAGRFLEEKGYRLLDTNYRCRWGEVDIVAQEGDELVFVEEGEITALVGDDKVDVGPGAFAALPRGLKHTIKVRGETAKLLITVVPAGIERFFIPTEEAHKDPATFGVEINE